jgi:hypothetical protein
MICFTNYATALQLTSLVKIPLETFPKPRRDPYFGLLITWDAWRRVSMSLLILGRVKTRPLFLQEQASHYTSQDVSLPALPAFASQGSFTSSSHTYRRLPSIDKRTVDKWLELCKVAEKRAYKCLWPDCRHGVFRKKCNAHLHVHHKHFGTTKLFECVTW